MDTIALDGQRSPLYQNADFDEKKNKKNSSKHGYIGIRWMHSELILSFAKKVLNTNLDILAL